MDHDTDDEFFSSELAGITGTRMTDQVRSLMGPPGELPADVEMPLLHALTRPLAADENHRAGAVNRERELREIIVKLGAIDALTLRRRLELDRRDDPLAVAFRRLTPDRRERLRAFLASPRRQFG